MSELEALRTEISELDRRLLELLNRRLELVAAVRDYKDSAGERWIDPEREAELLQALVAANPGPLSERGVTSIFSAVLDVLKQEVAADRRAPASPGRAAERPRAVERLAVVGTGLIGTSVALAAGAVGHPQPRLRLGLRRARAGGGAGGDRARARRSPRRSQTPSSSSSRFRSARLRPSCGRCWTPPDPDVVVTDVASTKRPLASIEDPALRPRPSRRRRRHRRPGARRGRPLRRGDVVPDPDRGVLGGERRARGALRRLARRAHGADGRRGARPPARAHEPPPPRAREPPHASRRGGGGGRRRAARLRRRLAARDDAARRREPGGLERHLPRQRRRDRRGARPGSAPRSTSSSRRCGAATATGSRRRSPPPRPRASGWSRSPTAPRRRS